MVVMRMMITMVTMMPMMMMQMMMMMTGETHRHQPLLYTLGGAGPTRHGSLYPKQLIYYVDRSQSIGLGTARQMAIRNPRRCTGRMP